LNQPAALTLVATVPVHKRSDVGIQVAGGRGEQLQQPPQPAEENKLYNPLAEFHLNIKPFSKFPF